MIVSHSVAFSLAFLLLAACAADDPIEQQSAALRADPAVAVAADQEEVAAPAEFVCRCKCVLTAKASQGVIATTNGCAVPGGAQDACDTSFDFPSSTSCESTTGACAGFWPDSYSVFEGEPKPDTPMTGVLTGCTKIAKAVGTATPVTAQQEP